MLVLHKYRVSCSVQIPDTRSYDLLNNQNTVDCSYLHVLLFEYSYQALLFRTQLFYCSFEVMIPCTGKIRQYESRTKKEKRELHKCAILFKGNPLLHCDDINFIFVQESACCFFNPIIGKNLADLIKSKFRYHAILSKFAGIR